MSVSRLPQPQPHIARQTACGVRKSVWSASAARSIGPAGRCSPRPLAAPSAAASADDALLEPRGVARVSLDEDKLELVVQRAAERLAEVVAAQGAAAGTAAPDAALSAAVHRVVEEEVHAAFETEMAAAHGVLEAEVTSAKRSVKEAVDAALQDGAMKFDVTANVNTVMAITAVISYWRGVGGLLDILFEDSLEGYVACVLFGWVIIWIIRSLRLPVVEGNGLGL